MNPTRKSRGFTLIELLTVIAIIAILMGLLFPVLGTARRSAQKATAKNDITQIVNALKAYYTDYGQYPTNPTGATTIGTSDMTYGDTSVGSALPNNELFDVLRGIATLGAEGAENPRQIAYMDIPFVKDGTNPKSGIGTTTGSGVYYDPWGSPYNVRLDGDYDNKINTAPPYLNSPSASNSYINAGVIAWSYGPNKTLGDGGSGDAQSAKFDDVLSWQ